MNGGEQTAEFFYLIAVLVLVGSALLVRRIPIGQGLKMFAGWVLVFLAVFVAFSLKDDIVAVAGRVLDQRKAETTGLQVGEELRIKQALDGHFWVDGEVNGENMRFLVDSGATTTSISAGDADRAGIDRGGLPALVQTANGAIMVERGRVELLRVGAIERQDMAVHVSKAFGDTNVLGMNFLSSLASWRVEGGYLILKP